MICLLMFLLTTGVTLGQHGGRQTRLEDVENDNLVSERRASSNTNYPKANSIYSTPKPTSPPQFHYGFTPLKQYFTSATENPPKNIAQSYQNQGRSPYSIYQPQLTQQYQNQYSEQYYQQPQQQAQYEYQTQRAVNVQENRPVEYLQPQAPQAPHIVYQPETGKADQYVQIVPQYSTLPEQYQNNVPIASQSDKSIQVAQQTQQQLTQYSTLPQQYQDIQTYQQSQAPSIQYATVAQNVQPNENSQSPKVSQYQQEVLQNPQGNSEKAVVPAQPQDVSSLQYLQGFDSVSYLGNGQIGSDFLNSFQDVFNQKLFYQPQSAASTAINSYVAPQGAFQYYTLVPSNLIENAPKGGFVQPFVPAAHTKAPSQDNFLSQSPKSFQSNPNFRQSTGSKKYVKYTNNIGHSRKNLPKTNIETAPSGHQNYQNVTPRRPSSLLDSYVPSVLQAQYYKDLELKHQQQQQQQEQQQQLQQHQAQEPAYNLQENLQPPPQNDQHIKGVSQKRSPNGKRSYNGRI